MLAVACYWLIVVLWLLCVMCCLLSMVCYLLVVGVQLSSCVVCGLLAHCALCVIGCRVFDCSGLFVVRCVLSMYVVCSILVFVCCALFSFECCVLCVCCLLWMGFRLSLYCLSLVVVGCLRFVARCVARFVLFVVCC